MLRVWEEHGKKERRNKLKTEGRKTVKVKRDKNEGKQIRQKMLQIE
jgi:hypothetical protein